MRPISFLTVILGKRSSRLTLVQKFKVVTHRTCFGKRQDVSDPEVIAYRGKNHMVLIFADYDFESMYAKEIRTAKIAVLIVSNNHEGPEKWGPRILSSQEEIYIQLQKRKKPFVGFIGESGRVTKIRLYRKDEIKEIKLGKHK